MKKHLTHSFLVPSYGLNIIPPISLPKSSNPSLTNLYMSSKALSGSLSSKCSIAFSPFRISHKPKSVQIFYFLHQRYQKLYWWLNFQIILTSLHPNLKAYLWVLFLGNQIIEWIFDKLKMHILLDYLKYQDFLDFKYFSFNLRYISICQ